MSVHTKIRKFREDQKLTHQQFADAVGVSRGAVQQWEKEGGTAPNRTRQPVVAAFMKISVEELMAATATLSARESGQDTFVGTGSASKQPLAHIDKEPVAINTIATTIERFVTLVAASDDLTRDQIKTLLARLCDQPTRSGEVIDHLMKHFGAANANSTEQPAAKSYSSGVQ